MSTDNVNKDHDLKALFGSDSDEEEATTPAVADGEPLENDNDNQEMDMKDLFGSDEDEEPIGATGPSSLVEREQGEGEVGGEMTADAPQGPMNIAVDLFDALPQSGLRVAKLPNSLMIEPECFVYDEFQGDENAGAPVIRWRYGIDSASGDLIRESNARIVTWSDGSQTLNVGKDMFQVKTIDVAADNTFLYVRHPSLVQCQSKLQEKLLFNPIGVEKSIRPKTRTTEASRIKVKQTATLVDPVREREEKEKVEEARIKDKEKLQEKQKQVMRRSIMQTKLPPKRQSYLSAAFLEEDDDYAADGHLEDDGFIVPDDDEDVEDAEDVDDVHRGDIDDEKGAERLAEIQKKDQQATGERPPIASMGGRIEESDEEKEEEEQQPKKKRAVVMDSDSE